MIISVNNNSMLVGKQINKCRSIERNTRVMKPFSLPGVAMHLASVTLPLVVAYLVLVASPFVFAGGAAPDPYPYLHSYNATARPVNDQSPDPLQTFDWDKDVNTTQLQVFYAYPSTAIATPVTSFQNVSSLLTNTVIPNIASPSHVVVTGLGQLQFDWTVEHAAWLEFDSPDLPSADAVYLSVSEYLLPDVVNAGPRSPNKTAVPIKYKNTSLPFATYRLELNAMLYEGVRYGWLVVDSFTVPWTITAVRLVCQIKPTPYAATIHIPQLTWNNVSVSLERIFWVSGYTLKLNLMEDYFGSILVDRGDRYSWTGDAHVEQAAAFALFQNMPFILENINRTSCADCSNGIESYALYWVLSLADYYDHSGDAASVISLSASATQKLDHAIAVWDTVQNTFYGGDERLGSYFEEPNLLESQRCYRYLAVHALRQFSRVSGLIGGPLASISQHYSAAADALLVKIKSDFQWLSSLRMHSSVDAILAQVPSPSEARVLLNTTFISAHQLVSFTPFNHYFVVRALFEAGAVGEAMQAMLACWGGMLDLGATTFWEVFSPQWLSVMSPGRDVSPPPNGQNGYTSLAHPWAAGPARLIMDYVLGIRIMHRRENGVAILTWQVIPITLALTPNINGVHGSSGISVHVEFANGIFSVRNAPKGSVGTIGIPSWRDAYSLSEVHWSNGTIVWSLQNDATIQNVRVTLTTLSTGTFLLITNIDCHQQCVLIATYKLNKQRSDIRLIYSIPTLPYAATFIGIDNITRGNWIGRYGSKGYIFYSDTDIVNILPSTTTVQTHRGGSQVPRVKWDVDTLEDVALQMPSNSTEMLNQRMLGAATTGNPNACQQTFEIDITQTGLTPLTVSIYLVDVNNRHRRCVIEIFDLYSRDVVAEWKVVEEFSSGTWLTWSYHGALRIRVAYVRAISDTDNVGISAIALD